MRECDSKATQHEDIELTQQHLSQIVTSKNTIGGVNAVNLADVLVPLLRQISWNYAAARKFELRRVTSSSDNKSTDIPGQQSGTANSIARLRRDESRALDRRSATVMFLIK